MNRYTPLWSQIVDSSVWCEEDMVVKVFVTMLAKQDRDYVVRGTAFNIGVWAHKTEAEVLRALEVLSAPDTKRVEPQPFEGRRIERVDGGWLILNGEKYQRMMQEANRRDYHREKQREYRERKKGGSPSGREQRFVKAVEAGDEGEADRIAAEGLPSGPAPGQTSNGSAEVEEFRRKMALALQQANAPVLEPGAPPAAPGRPAETFPEV